MAIDDYYRLLDVAPDAAREEIRGAYRSKRDALQAKEGDDTRAKVAQLNRAWNVLSDPAQRDRYDDRLAEQREGGEVVEYDDDGDEDGDGRPIAVTRAARRARAREARTGRAATIVVPEGLTQASTRSRLMALGFDLLVLLFIFLAVYQMGLSLIDRHFPGERHHGSDLVTQQNSAIKAVNTDKEKISAADKAAAAAKARHDTAGEQAAKDKSAAAHAAETKDAARRDALGKQVDKINHHLGPWINLTFVVAMLILLVYLVPSTAISGKTIGKRLRHIRVVKLDGSRPGWSTALVRFGVPLLVGSVLAVLLRFGPLGLGVAVLGIIGWVSNPNRQGLHDRLAKTIVVDD
jgi:Na+-transporting methylmalonyl-CoA/oxaloacetate decarboxylase gamma subunit